MNIFHELAEKAFKGRYLLGRPIVVPNDLPDGAPASFWVFYYEVTCAFQFYSLDREEQALALLFIGEMYQSSAEAC